MAVHGVQLRYEQVYMAHQILPLDPGHKKTEKSLIFLKQTCFGQGKVMVPKSAIYNLQTK